jgi:hypothetical protein
MSYRFSELCERLSVSVLKIPFHWTYTWADSDGVGILASTGIIWATKTLTFNDDHIYGAPRNTKQLLDGIKVVEARIERSLRGPRLNVVTRYIYP